MVHLADLQAQGYLVHGLMSPETETEQLTDNLECTDTVLRYFLEELIGRELSWSSTWLPVHLPTLRIHPGILSPAQRAGTQENEVPLIHSGALEQEERGKQTSTNACVLYLLLFRGTC